MPKQEADVKRKIDIVREFDPESHISSIEIEIKSNKGEKFDDYLNHTIDSVILPPVQKIGSQQGHILVLNCKMVKSNKGGKEKHSFLPHRIASLISETMKVSFDVTIRSDGMPAIFCRLLDCQLIKQEMPAFKTSEDVALIQKLYFAVRKSSMFELNSAESSKGEALNYSLAL